MTITEIPYTPVSQSSPMRDISTVMLAKNLDAQKDMGNEMVKMMELSVQPELGQNIDLRV